jgi:predicted N-acyltransferase
MKTAIWRNFPPDAAATSGANCAAARIYASRPWLRATRITQTAFTDELYAQYLEVYAQSAIHFDRLSADFFRGVLNDPALDGRLFLYYRGDTLIGHNLCFIHNGTLVDKTIGFRYPLARESNLYFISWMQNLDFARREGLSHYIAGWTDPAVKAALGASFTPTRHAVHARSPLLGAILRRIAGRFEPDRQWFAER